MARYEPGSPEWKARRAQLLTDELGQPLRWFYLSFADGGFLGPAIVQACGELHAVEKTHELGINPGGEIAIFGVPDDHPPPDGASNRLLSLSDLKALFGEDEMIQPFKDGK